jgi:hypothetical protein
MSSNNRVRIKVVPKSERDLRKLARALLLLAEQQAEQDQAPKPEESPK